MSGDYTSIEKEQVAESVKLVGDSTSTELRLCMKLTTVVNEKMYEFKELVDGAVTLGSLLRASPIRTSPEASLTRVSFSMCLQDIVRLAHNMVDIMARYESYGLVQQPEATPTPAAATAPMSTGAVESTSDSSSGSLSNVPSLGADSVFSSV